VTAAKPVLSEQVDRSLSWAQSLRRWVLRWSVNDWFTFLFLVVLNVAWLRSSDGADKAIAGPMVVGLLFVFVVGVLGYARSEAGPQRLRALAYRLIQFGCIEASYFTFQHLLPAANHGTLDLELYQLDLDWFGGSPTLWMDQFVTSGTVEWFSFFYFSYYVLLLAHVVPILFFGTHKQRLAEFGLGMTIVGTVGQACYLIVPGFGPYHAIPHLFSNPLPDGFWWNLVMGLVHTGGAQKDIFPSLHTALPTYILLFSFGHRRERPYDKTWWLVAFFTVNIVISTMFLRWHYLIDVIAGLALAFGAWFAAPRWTEWERVVRERRNLGPIWPTWTKNG
jgi:membrane-associated phospholipid phosphatase